MPEFARPTLVCSKCIEFGACRYNGASIRSDLVRKLAAYANFIPVCPEVEIGLGVPRHAVRVVRKQGADRLVQPDSGREVTDEMLAFADGFLDSLGEVDGFILKNRSPSCGIKDVKVYPGTGKVGSIGRGVGFFAGKVIEKFPLVPIEDEARLTNLKIREHFLTRIFTLARFREVKRAGTMKALVRFQSTHKFLLLAYNQKELRTLGRITANAEHRRVDKVLADYEEHLRAAIARSPKYASNLNVLMHAFGYFSDELSVGEKAYFLDMLADYRAGKIQLSPALSVLKAWIIRFQTTYLMYQTYFEPFPEELAHLEHPRKGTKYRMDLASGNG